MLPQAVALSTTAWQVRLLRGIQQGKQLAGPRSKQTYALLCCAVLWPAACLVAAVASPAAAYQF